MEYILMLTENKDLLTTLPCPIFKGENCGKFKILVPTEYLDFTPTIQMSLADGERKVLVCSYEQETYKGRLVVYLPIKAEYTKNAGDICMWLTFFGAEADDIVKSSRETISVLDRDCGYHDSHLDLMEEIAGLKIQNGKFQTEMDKKADNIAYDKEAKELALTSNGEPIGTPLDMEGITNDEVIEFSEELDNVTPPAGDTSDEVIYFSKR